MFGSMMGDFDEDMFMNNPMNMMQMQMRNMNRMMNSLMPDPFNMLMPFDQGRNNALMERNNGPVGMGGLFGFPMPNMNRLLNADIGGTNGASYCSSSVISMSSGPDGRPQIYQATSSSKTGPGGIRETRKTVQDSSTGLKKMAIGHHIGDRAHIIEKEQDLRSGQLEEHQEFINLDEEEAEDFDREFSTKARHGAHVLHTGPRSREMLAIEDVDDTDAHGRHRRQLPALPAPPSAISKSANHTHPYKNTKSSRRQQRVRVNALPQHQQVHVEEENDEPQKKQQKTYQEVIGERNTDDSLVIIEEPDDSEDEVEPKK